MYNMAHGWATGIDITFVSRHYLLNPVFTDEGIENCTIYSDDAFSCEVKLKKNMKLYTGVSKIDEMHDDLFFVYYENGYKLVDMQSRAEQENYEKCIELSRDSWEISLAEYKLGEIYSKGIGVKKNHKIAEKYYRDSMSKGNPYAKKKFVAGKYIKK